MTIISTLLVLSQCEDESLSQFVARFAIEIQGFTDAHPSLIMQVFLMGLRPSRFLWSLIEKPPATIPEMLQCANQYITAEALMARRCEDNKRPRMEQARGSASAPSAQPRKRPDQPKPPLPRTLPLPLNTSSTEIFLQIREKGLLRQPNPLKTTHKDRSKYCKFHWDYNHDMEDYHDLQNQIEELIRRGHLGHYLKEPEVTSCPKGPVERQIDVITVGPATGDSSSTARKAYARSTVEKCH
ncbi:unnamed protein product [Musa acuminata subsp. malaccensis]|uniref:(wild Malaysian banana) hypothetical protein n=1 Tax=Musa acuminata subsp. malaccensis TaxID=214687 RepID=A0A804KMK4_MUSAM|nr:PREDICTED: uncharacterized protein LOC103998954 [Musa acuminata subsp. malaccensis]CAG1836160.1 unnamed protein product [Musa acuminata subsp. malaccensis]